MSQCVLARRNHAIIREDCSGWPGELQTRGASVLPRHVCRHRMREPVIQRGHVCTLVRCGEKRMGGSPTASTAGAGGTEGTLGRVAPPGQGLGQLMGPQGCPDLLLRGHPPQQVLGDLRVWLISGPS